MKKGFHKSRMLQYVNSILLQNVEIVLFKLSTKKIKPIPHCFFYVSHVKYKKKCSLTSRWSRKATQLDGWGWSWIWTVTLEYTPSLTKIELLFTVCIIKNSNRTSRNISANVVGFIHIETKHWRNYIIFSRLFLLFLFKKLSVSRSCYTEV